MKRLIAAGKMRPRRTHACVLGAHYGRPLSEDVFRAAGPMWAGFAICSACGSTVTLGAFVQGAA